MIFIFSSFKILFSCRFWGNALQIKCNFLKLVLVTSVILFSVLRLFFVSSVFCLRHSMLQFYLSPPLFLMVEIWNISVILGTILLPCYVMMFQNTTVLWCLFFLICLLIINNSNQIYKSLQFILQRWIHLFYLSLNFTILDFQVDLSI